MSRSSWVVPVLGARLTRLDVDSAVARLGSIRDGYYHEVRATGRAGWYRILADPARVGYVATAEMLVCIAEGGRDFFGLEASLNGLIEGQAADGGWSFLSNEPRSVVDATAWVLYALSVHRENAAALRLDSAAAIDRGVQFLRTVQQADGGFGLLESASWRAYSTALAIQALLRAGVPVTDDSLRRGARSLASRADPTSGGWRDAQGNLSIAVTAACVVALSQYESVSGLFGAELSRARSWLVSVRGSDLWGKASSLPSDEEVTYLASNGQPLKIEYHFTRRPAGLRGLHTGGLVPVSCTGMRALVLGVNKDAVSEACGMPGDSYTSSSLFDALLALLEFQRLLPSDWLEVWWNNRRIVVRRRSDNVLVVYARRYWPLGALAAVSFLTVLGLNLAGITSGFGWATAWFLVTTLVLGVAGNILTGILTSVLERLRSHG